MSQSHCQLLYHIVYATRHRERWLVPAIAGDVHAYLGGIVRKEGGSALIVNGAIEHVHLLVYLHQDIAISSFLRVIKARSSDWIHRTYPRRREFAWQGGYGAFTVSRWDREKIHGYIRRQEEHHRRVPFKEEYVALLEEHGVEYDPRYLWE